MTKRSRENVREPEQLYSGKTAFELGDMAYATRFPDLDRREFDSIAPAAVSALLTRVEELETWHENNTALIGRIRYRLPDRPILTAAVEEGVQRLLDRIKALEAENAQLRLATPLEDSRP